MKRTLKQLLYGFFYLVILLAVVLGAYLLFFQKSSSCFDNIKNQDEVGVDCGGACIDCDLKNVKDLIVQPANIFDNGNRTTTILATILNPNKTLGIEILPYTIKVFNFEDQEIYSADRRAFIYPAQNRLVLEAGIDVEANNIKSATITLDYDASVWKKISPPPAKLTDFRTRALGNQIEVVGRVINDNDYPLDQVAVLAVFSNKIGIKAAASKTVVGKVEPFSFKTFQIIIPLKEGLLSEINLDEAFIALEAKR
tara:strand:- start:21600 stop:22361 length:762 start_codon:yes stop_codon:yes gene_type:complete